MNLKELLLAVIAVNCQFVPCTSNLLSFNYLKLINQSTWNMMNDSMPDEVTSVACGGCKPVTR